MHCASVKVTWDARARHGLKGYRGRSKALSLGFRVA